MKRIVRNTQNFKVEYFMFNREHFIYRPKWAILGVVVGDNSSYLNWILRDNSSNSVKVWKPYIAEIAELSDHMLKKMTRRNRRNSKLNPVTGELVQNSYKCKICEAPYQTAVGLMFHTKAKHEGAKYPCTLCDYVSAFQPNTRRHMLEKHEGKVYSCDQCDYKAGRREMLNTHIDYEHRGVRYTCDFCPYVGKEQGKLNRHVRMVHLRLKG